MAQVLKDEVKVLILESAKQEFLQKGYEATTMRSIAKKANMTVGNLYRYFDSKEDINYQIVGPTLRQLDSIVKDITKNTLSLETRVFDVRFNVAELTNILDGLAEKMVKVFINNQTEFNILMINSSLNNDLVSWFSKVISEMITVSFGNDNNIIDINVLSRSFAVAIFDGFKEIFKYKNIDEYTLIRIARIYFRSYVYMLNAGEDYFIGEPND
ncbi:MAG: helix-turn-helix domain-containing protein [Erysipelotrichaceae bacterium]|nr:helix-turn-helix domain-containing protein [Erysipelotrichaceae bacterium]